jgi:ABC-2 type transport system permease protein
LNWEHLKAIVWLRQRLFRNRMRRSGKANLVVTVLLLCLALLASIAMFFVSILLGVKLLPGASPDHLLFVWTMLIGQFLFFWTIGLLTELQRSEVISLQKLLYFPISLTGTFLVNYLSSFVSITLIVFLPAMIGLCIASVVALGPYFLITFPLLAGLVLMVTAVTYQLQGWLATLMMNKRRRRTVVAFITAGFIILAQIPNLLNRFFLRSHAGDNQARIAASEQYLENYNKLAEQLQSHEIDQQQFQERVADLNQTQQARFAKGAERDRPNAAPEFGTADLARWVRVLDLVVPPGWMAYGAMSAAQHAVWPGLLGSLGLIALGAASLRRSYHTTLRFYRGDYQSSDVAKKKVPAQVGGKRATFLVERQVPWAPERAAATALATLRSLLRAPEVKMMLLSVLFIPVIFSSMMLARRRTEMSPSVRPLMAMGIIIVEMLSLSQILQNQFGFDRDGFRTFVLSPSRRRDILLGKNLALAPFLLGMGGVTLVGLEFFHPSSVTGFAASLLELVSAFLVVCLVGNYTSIMIPTAVRAGSLRASSSTLLGSLVRFLAVLGMAAALLLIFAPLGIDWLLQATDLGPRVPVYLILAAIELSGVVLLYRFVLERQGSLLQQREQRILQEVTTKND